MSWDFMTATRIVYGLDSLKRLGQETARLGRHALLMTGQGSARRSGALDQATAILDAAGVTVTLYEGVEPDPTFATVNGAAELARREDCDMVVGLGGGSAMDAAKAVAGIARWPYPVDDYYDTDRMLPGKGLPFVAVPTTAGTGAEVTKNAVLSDPVRALKQSLRGDYLLADVALVDPALTVSMSPEVTAATGGDALTQAIESYVSKNASPLTDALATQAIQLIGRHLKRAYQDGADIKARTAVSLGSLLAGMALTNARLGAVHGLAHPLGVRFGLSHGLVCALLLPYEMAYNLRGEYPLAEVTRRKYAHVAELMGLDVTGCPDIMAAERATDYIFKLNRELDLDRRLSEFGVTEADLPTLAAESLPSGSLKANPRPLTQEELEELLHRAL
ncbi:MAG: iron-containing alcohol dehydrogenase [Chloroflexi bacterium]|nr:iron-containing alcohol dehydrogenase [Chloroflexota bacterium]MBU1749897.1 iron-containing alcohol dehydrogenase [Chloroflexota bacterium]MBU1879643.1 iron-containing alcohol dehydrogenase [Chloroflexota bacterium]